MMNRTETAQRDEMNRALEERLANPAYDAAIARAVIKRAAQATRARRLGLAAAILLGLCVGLGIYLGYATTGIRSTVADVQFIGEPIYAEPLPDDETDVLLQAAVMW